MVYSIYKELSYLFSESTLPRLRQRWKVSYADGLQIYVLGAVRKADAVQRLVLALHFASERWQSSSIDHHPINITTVNETLKATSNPATVT